MFYINLLGKFREKFDLDCFSRNFFSAIDVFDYQERESGNYLGGRYFKGILAEINIIISLSDEEDSDFFPYWVQISADLSSFNFFLEMVNDLIVKNLSPIDFNFVRVINFGKVNEIRVNCL